MNTKTLGWTGCAVVAVPALVWGAGALLFWAIVRRMTEVEALDGSGEL